MKEKILTDNNSEKITVRWDGTRFALIQKPLVGEMDVIVLNPREMLTLIEFAGKCGGE